MQEMIFIITIVEIGFICILIGGLIVTPKFKNGFIVRGDVFFPADLLEPICLTEFLDKWVAVNDKPGQPRTKDIDWKNYEIDYAGE
jgi:hypothetical protein